MFSSLVKEAHTAFLKDDFNSCLELSISHLSEYLLEPFTSLTPEDRVFLAALAAGSYQRGLSTSTIEDEDFLMEIKRLLQLAIYKPEAIEQKKDDIQSALDDFQKKHEEDTARLRKQVLPEVADIIDSIRAVSLEWKTPNVSPKKQMVKHLAESKLGTKVEGGSTGGIDWIAWNHEIRKQLLDVQIPIDQIAAGDLNVADWAFHWKNGDSMGRFLQKLVLEGGSQVISSTGSLGGRMAVDRMWMELDFGGGDIRSATPPEGAKTGLPIPRSGTEMSLDGSGDVDFADITVERIRQELGGSWCIVDTGDKNGGH